VIDQLNDAAGPLIGEWLPSIVAVIVVLIVIVVLWKLLARRRGSLPKPETDLTIHVASLGAAGPPPGAPVLEHYNVPVRLAAVVVAPAGRVHPLPPPDQLHKVFEVIAPGLAQVVVSHDALIRRWPEQLSTTGFAHVLFRYAKLPGDAGKGTAWCSAAGVTKVDGHSVMVGLVMRSDHPNGLGQVIVEQATKWLDVVRVKPPQ
jgi:hypothetical protein